LREEEYIEAKGVHSSELGLLANGISKVLEGRRIILG
jgi:hypothetical protein